MSARQREDSDHRYRFLSRFGSVILSGGIAAIPKSLYMYSAELELVPQEVWFVGYILAHRWTAELPFPSLRKMSVHTGVSYQMLHRYKNSLIEKNYLEIIPRTRPNGGRTTNYYDFSGLFQKLEALLIRDNGGREEDLEDDEDSEVYKPQFTGSGKRQLTSPGKAGLSGSSKRGATAPEHPSSPHVNRDIPSDSSESMEQISGNGNFRPFTSSVMDARQVWGTVLMDLRKVSGAQVHLNGSQIIERQRNELRVSVSSTYAAEWLQRRVGKRASELLSGLGGETVSVRFLPRT